MGEKGFNPEQDPLEHPNISEDVKRAYRESRLLGGLDIEKVTAGQSFEIETKNHIYTLRKIKNDWEIKGHPKYCPEFTAFRVNGSSWPGSSMLNKAFVGRGMLLEGYLIKKGLPLITSPIQEIKEITAGK